MLHATCGQQVATAPFVSPAEMRSGGLHTAAQVAEAPQVVPHQVLTPSQGIPWPLTQTITRTFSNRQVSMLPAILMLPFHIASALDLLLP